MPPSNISSSGAQPRQPTIFGATRRHDTIGLRPTLFPLFFSSQYNNYVIAISYFIQQLTLWTLVSIVFLQAKLCSDLTSIVIPACVTKNDCLYQIRPTWRKFSKWPSILPLAVKPQDKYSSFPTDSGVSFLSFYRRGGIFIVNFPGSWSGDGWSNWTFRIPEGDVGKQPFLSFLSSVWPVLANENLKAICKNLTPDTLTGELEFTDIFR